MSKYAHCFGHVNQKRFMINLLEFFLEYYVEAWSYIECEICIFTVSWRKSRLVVK